MRVKYPILNPLDVMPIHEGVCPVHSEDGPQMELIEVQGTTQFLRDMGYLEGEKHSIPIRWWASGRYYAVNGKFIFQCPHGCKWVTELEGCDWFAYQEP